jgi:hypothetical protein
MEASMALETFINWRPTYDSQVRLQRISEILTQYEKLGIRLTLRQLYYQLVSKNIVRNHQREYKRLGELLSNARLAGRVDWSAIEDRVRFPEGGGGWPDVRDLIKGAIAGWRSPRFDEQPIYLELWCEKDALSSVFAGVCHQLHVTSMVNRGYSSTTAMYDAGKRLKREALARKRPAKIFYLGDFDPSGEDMVRDLRERLLMLAFGVDLEISKIALTKNQIETFKLPPNPAKITDSRAQGFIAKHGESSYEVDALPPEVLQQLVREHLEGSMDMKLYNATIAREDRERAAVRAALEPQAPMIEIELGIVEQLTAYRLGLV